MEPFENRRHAGIELARVMSRHRSGGGIVLAVPRGGVVVGYEVATALDLDLDVIVPRKIRAPDQPELAIGAIASWGDHELILDQHAMEILRVPRDYIEREVQDQLSEINRRLLAYRQTADPPIVTDRTAILVDDGIATGYTIRAAAMAVRNLGAARVTLAVPVAPPDSIAAMRSFVDEVICLRTPSPFAAVGYWYSDFVQVSDSEVVDLLDKARARTRS